MTDGHVLIGLGLMVWLAFAGVIIALEWRDYKEQVRTKLRLDYLDEQQRRRRQK